MTTKHHAELDGIRGIAILLVMIVHYFGFEPMSMVDNLFFKAGGIGWAGVDLFFVLSGFLITGILYDTRESKSYLSTFFARRALRIFPLYFAFVGGLLITAYLVLPSHPDSLRWRDVQGWYWTYTVNFLIALKGGWGAAPLESGHLWSLAIEEQFYLLWPFVVWKLQRGTLMKLCLVLIVAVLVLRTVLFASGVNPVSIFVATPTRIDALLVGAFAAMLLRGSIDIPLLQRRSRQVMFIGAAVVGVAIVSQQGTHQYGVIMQTIGFTALAATSAAIVVGARVSEPSTLLRRGLRVPLLTFFGQYSYALYMLHGLCLVLVKQFFPPIEQLPTVQGIAFHWIALRALCATLVAIAAALLSWHLLEKRFLALKPGYAGPSTRSASPTTVLGASS